MAQGAQPAALSAPSLTRLSLIYGASLAVLGAVMPYLALELKARGVSGLALAAALGALPLGRLLAGPAWSLLADLTRSQRRILRAACLLALVGLGGLNLATGWWAAAAVLFLAVGRAPMGPVVDGLTLRALGGDRDRYGSIRLWGSVGFLIATLVVPLLSAHAGVPRMTTGLLLTTVLLGLVWNLPDGQPQAAARLRPALRALGADRSFGWLLACAALHFSAHVATTGFLAVHMASMGVSEVWAGVAIALGVLVEVGLMSRAAAIFARVPAQRLLLAATLVAVCRWVLTALATEGWQLVALQATHGFTFGAFWLSSVSLVASRAPPEVGTSAQGLLSAAVGGVGAFIGLAGASLITEAGDTRAIFACGAVAAALAALCASRVEP